MRFFLVDQVTEFDPGVFARGVKNVTLSEDFIQDHFPDYPVFPGTLIIEAMAQLGGFLAESACNTNGQSPRRAVLAQVDRAKFYEPTQPGDQIELRCRLDSQLEGAIRIDGQAYVRDTCIARADLTFVLRSINSDNVHAQRRQLYRIWTRRLDPNLTIR